MEICNLEVCSGCGLCSISCPKKCILMNENSIGHLYPKIDESQCVKCGKCKRICPTNNEPKQFKAKKVYACWSLDECIRTKSTSGGLATVIAENVLKCGGVVYGAALVNNHINHIRVTKVEELDLIQGSKYVESPIVTIINSIISDLSTNMKVLFIGTPCQCAAIRQLGGKKENLILVELICTGVPPQKLLWEHLGLNSADTIRFRDEIGTQLTIKKDGLTVYQKPVWKDYFLMGFSKHLYFRDSCYSCRYASLERVADITIGDFWGLGKVTPFEQNIKNGVSALFINNSTGELVFNSIKEKIFYEERELREAIEGNPRYYNASEKHPNREMFIDTYRKKGFRKALKKALKKERIKYAIFSLSRVVKRMLKKR